MREIERTWNSGKKARVPRKEGWRALSHEINNMEIIFSTVGDSCPYWSITGI